jgi:hypothetical protein
MFVSNLCNSIVHICLKTVLSAKPLSLKYLKTINIFMNLLLSFEKTWILYWLPFHIRNVHTLLVFKTFRTILLIISKYITLLRQKLCTLWLISGLNCLFQLIIVSFLLYLNHRVYSLTLSVIFD